MNRRPQRTDQATLRTVLRVGGPILLVIGLVLTFAALSDFFASFGSFQQPRSFGLAFIGIPLIAAGGWMIQAGFIGPATRYVAGEVAPGVRDALETIGVAPASGPICPACGAENAIGARFCDACGAALARACPSCGAENDADATFCNQCGTTLPAVEGPRAQRS